MTLQALRLVGRCCAVLSVAAPTLMAFILVVGGHRWWPALVAAALATLLSVLLFRTRLASVPETALVPVAVATSLITARWTLCALALCVLALALSPDITGRGTGGDRRPGVPAAWPVLAGVAVALPTVVLGATELADGSVPAGHGRYLLLAAVAVAVVGALHLPAVDALLPRAGRPAAVTALGVALVAGAWYVCTPVAGDAPLRDAVNTWGLRLLLLVTVVLLGRAAYLSWRSALPALGFSVAATVGVLALSAMSLQWANPTTTRFSALDRDGALQQWVSADDISRYVMAEVILHEDNGRFGYPGLSTRTTPVNYRLFYDRIRVQLHDRGILPGTGCTGADDPEVVETHMDDVSSKEQYASALDGLLDSDRCIRDPSGSEIPMQLAKNIYGNRDGAWYNKVADFLMVHPVALTADDRRILELYLNWSQFGPGIYGVCTASWYYFGTPPGALDVDRAAYLAEMLPVSSEVRRDAVHGGPLLDRDLLAAALGGGPGASDADVARAAGRADAVVTVLTGRHDALTADAAGDRWRTLLTPLGVGDMATGDGASGDPADTGGSCGRMPGGVADRLRAEGTDPDAWVALNRGGAAQQ